MTKYAIVATLIAGIVLGQERRLADAVEFRAQVAAQKKTAANQAVPATWYDTSNRATVAQAYLQDYAPLKNTPLGWTGNLSTGDPGATSDAYRAAVLQAVNWYRAMAGVRASVTFDPVLNAKAQKGALMIASNRALSHNPPNTWTHYTAEGAEALGKSNLCQGFLSDPGCLEQYMIDEGSNNAPVGHRRWILYPPATTMGTGDAIGGYNLWNVLWVLPVTTLPAAATRDEFVAWPPPGYFPRQLAAPRWSLHLRGANFTNATVTMSKAGSAIPLTIVARNGGYGDPAIVWTPSAPYSGSDTVYDVSVQNVSVGSTTRSFSYQVILFDPGTAATFTWSPASASVPASGGTFTMQLTVAPASTSWAAASSASWVRILSSASGTGSATVQYQVSQNTGGARSATITVGGQAFSIQQAAAQVAPGCTYALSTATIQAPSAGVRASVTLNSAGGCAWTASSDSSWAQVFPLTGSGTATFNIAVVPNFTTRVRTATVTVAGQLVTISQAASTSTSDERFVAMLYYNFMGRLPTPGEVTFQVQQGLGAGASRAELVRRFFLAPEFSFGGRLIAGLYVGILNRDAEYGGWLFQRNALAAGQVNQDEQTRNFLESAEFHMKNGTPSDADLVRLLYLQVLRRPPSADDITFHVGTMRTIGRSGFATNLLASAEFRANASSRLSAFLMYAAILNRGPSPSELEARAAQLEQGVSLASLIEAIVATPEFQSQVN